MAIQAQFNKIVQQRYSNFTYKNNWQRLHIDPLLLALLFTLLGFGLALLYSAAGDIDTVLKQVLRLGIAAGVMLIFAQIPPHKYKHWAPLFYFVSLALLFMVLAMGTIGKGAQRWLDLGFMRFQPSELMKLAIPLMLARYCSQYSPPLSFKAFVVASALILLPALLIIKQPDLGTAIMVLIAGGCILFLAGLRLSWIITIFCLVIAAIPLLWQFIHAYQKQRILTFFNPEKDPLGAGYHIIQSKIAIGSGGLFGKGWLNGSQSQLNFLPEHATDFIFAVAGEEFGLFGACLLILLILAIVVRCLIIAYQAQTRFTRLLASGIAAIFFFSAWINLAMVVGLVPVVGLPLPLISYGGTSMVATMAAFGIVMSIATHRNFLGREE